MTSQEVELEDVARPQRARDESADQRAGDTPVTGARALEPPPVEVG
jgi:hypothetical protein